MPHHMKHHKRVTGKVQWGPSRRGLALVWKSSKVSSSLPWLSWLSTMIGLSCLYFSFFVSFFFFSKVFFFNWSTVDLQCCVSFKCTAKGCVCVCVCVFMYVHVCVSGFSHVWLFVTLWTVACQNPLPMGLARQEYLSGLSCPPPRDLPKLGIEPTSLLSPALAGWFFTTSSTW